MSVLLQFFRNLYDALLIAPFECIYIVTKFRTWSRLFEFHLPLIPLKKVCSQEFFSQLWVYSKTDKDLSVSAWQPALKDIVSYLTGEERLVNTDTHTHTHIYIYIYDKFLSHHLMSASLPKIPYTWKNKIVWWNLQHLNEVNIWI